MPDLRDFKDNEDDIPLFKLLDEHLLADGWTIRGPANGHEAVNYGNSVYVHPDVYGGKARGWVEAITDQADLELRRKERDGT